MRILIATDAWHPQVNGVVQTYMRLREAAGTFGAELLFLTPDHFRTITCPGYPEIRFAVPSRKRARAFIESMAPDFIHIATEGPVGWTARSYCLRHGRPFTTSYHTKFPEYAEAWLNVPRAWTYRFLSRFHGPSAGIMVATRSLAQDLSARGFKHLMPWSRGVDADLFRPRADRIFGSEAPVFLYAGRVSREKNIEAFLKADLPGRKVVVGDGPHLASLKRQYPSANFTGKKTGEDLARHYASADVFVFPSTTDTFGLVLLEAMASGLPVAAYPVTGPVDVVANGTSGVLDRDLSVAGRKALTLKKADARQHALGFTWENTTRLFLENIRRAHERHGQPSAQFAPSRPSASDASFDFRALTTRKVST